MLSFSRQVKLYFRLPPSNISHLRTVSNGKPSSISLIWSRIPFISTDAVKNSLKSYLLKAVRNYCLDELRHRRIIDEHIAYELKSSSKDIDTTENYILYSDLCRQLKNALEQLPPQEREVFEMSRLENIKYQEIANRLNISVRTVEVRISKALKQLRILLKDFYLLLFLFLFH